MELQEVLKRLVKEGVKGKQYKIAVQIDDKVYQVVGFDIVNPVHTIFLHAE